MPPQEGSPRPPNQPLTTQEPPTRESAVEEGLCDMLFEKIWNAYPEDRKRNKTTCQAEFVLAATQGVGQEDILSAVQDYNTTTAGYTRSKVKFSDNWFRSAGWEGYIQRKNEKRKANANALASTLERCKTWIRTRDPMCRHITKVQLRALLEKGMVTPQMLTLAGEVA